MSGPKISFYTLTGRARAIVVGQLLCEQQSLVCYAKTQELLRSVQGLFGAFDRQMQLLALLERRTGAGAEQREALLTMREQREKEREQIKGALAERIPGISEKYFISEQAYAAKKEELKRLRLLQKRAETLLSAVEAFEQEQNEGSASRVAQDNERI